MPAPRVFDSERMLAIFLWEPENSKTRHLISRATYPAFVRYRSTGPLDVFYRHNIPREFSAAEGASATEESHSRSFLRVLLISRSADIWGRGIAHDARHDCASTCVASGSRYATGPFSTLDPDPSF